MMGERIERGRLGEKAAVRLLRRKRYRILERNYTCPVGEIDIVAIRGKTLCFVEVRTRTGTHSGTPLEMIHPAKQRQVVRAARYYLHHKNVRDVDVRFDAVGITLDARGKVVARELIPNAFAAEA